MLFDGKLFLSKTNWSILSIFNFSKNSAYIAHGKRPFKFARCAIVLLFELNGNPSLRVTSGGDSRQRNEFADFGALAPWKTRFFSKFHDSHVPRLHHGKPWTRPNFFLRLWIELRFCIDLAMHMLFDGKLFLSKTNWSIQSISFFHKIQYIVHGRRPSKFARCAIVLLFELNGNPSLRVTSGGRFASAKRICDFERNFEPGAASFQQIS